MVTFSERVKIADMFSKYVDGINRNNSFTVEKDPLTFMSWLESKGMLNEDNCRYWIASDNLDVALKHTTREYDNFSVLKDCT